MMTPPDQPGARPEADQGGGACPPCRRRLGAGQRQEPGDLRRLVRGLGAPAGQRRVRRAQLGDYLAGEEPQVRAQRPAGRPGQPRRVRGEPLDHRRVQQHARHRLQAQPGRPAGQLPGRPQQVLGPVPPGWRRPGHDSPRERGCLRRHRRWPPGHDIAGHLSIHTVSYTERHDRGGGRCVRR